MFGKIITSLCAGIILATAIGSVASAQTTPQPRKQNTQPYTNFEKLWFSMPVGRDS